MSQSALVWSYLQMTQRLLIFVWIRWVRSVCLVSHLCSLNLWDPHSPTCHHMRVRHPRMRSRLSCPADRFCSALTWPCRCALQLMSTGEKARTQEDKNEERNQHTLCHLCLKTQGETADQHHLCHGVHVCLYVCVYMRRCVGVCMCVRAHVCVCVGDNEKKAQDKWKARKRYCKWHKHKIIVEFHRLASPPVYSPTHV